MMNTFYALQKFIFLTLFSMLATVGWGQTVILNEELRDGSLPAGWAESDIDFRTAAGGYALFENTGSTLTTSAFDASAYSSIDVNFDVAKFGAGDNGPITVEYSLDGGSTWTTEGDSPTPESSDYVSASITINSVSATMQIRFNRSNSLSQKRLRDVVINGDGSGGGGPSGLLHCWSFNGTAPGGNFNSSPVDVSNREIGTGTITHTFTDVEDFGGSSENLCGGTGAGAAFCPRGGPNNEENNGESFTMAFSTEEWENITLSFWCNRTSTGFNNNQVAYSIDGGMTFTDFGSPFDPTEGGGVQTFDFTGISGVDDNPDFQIRITLDGARSSAGNNRYDNITLEASSFLPVEWLSFTATQIADPDAVQLDWSVAWEEMHDFYEVEHSTNGIRWEPIGRVQEDNQPQDADGRSPVKNYDFLHQYPETGLNLYRIRQVDLDGAEDYSIIQRVLFSGTEVDFSFAPNPARDRLYFTWPSDLQQQSIEMELISMQGRTQTLYRGEAPGQLRLPQLAAGMYQLLVRDTSGAIISRQRVVIQ